MAFLEFTFRSMWHFFGILILVGISLDYAFKFYNRSLRHWNIRKHGYPPAHCDADGDIVEQEEE